LKKPRQRSSKSILRNFKYHGQAPHRKSDPQVVFVSTSCETELVSPDRRARQQSRVSGLWPIWRSVTCEKQGVGHKRLKLIGCHVCRGGLNGRLQDDQRLIGLKIAVEPQLY